MCSHCPIAGNISDQPPRRVPTNLPYPKAGLSLQISSLFQLEWCYWDHNSTWMHESVLYKYKSSIQCELLTEYGVCRTTSPASYEVTNHLLLKVSEYSRGPSARRPVDIMFWLKAFLVSSSESPLSFAFLVNSASISWPNK
jgi:hypothetical protein